MQYTEGYLLDKRYVLQRYVGGGSFGEVWVALDQETELEVATKIYIAMDEKGLEDFKKEFQLSFELNHTNLLHANYLGVNEADRRPYLVMPFCPDGSVSQYAGQMKEEDLWRFIHDTAAGLAYLHSQNPPIIHQDIKPDNILILKSGDYVITDFGISRQLRQSMRKSDVGSAGAISYMGPERFSKNFSAVKASDIWSLGASIYELAVGDVPFCGMGGGLQKQGADMPELPEEFSERLNMVCQSCMAKETWNRPTAAQLRDYSAQVLDNRNPEITWTLAEDIKKEDTKPEGPVAVAPSPIEVQDNPQTQQNKVVKGTVAISMPEPEETAPAQAPESGEAVIPGSDESGFIDRAAVVESKVSVWAMIFIIIAGLALGAFIGFKIF